MHGSQMAPCAIAGLARRGQPGLHVPRGMQLRRFSGVLEPWRKLDASQYISVLSCRIGWKADSEISLDVFPAWGTFACVWSKYLWVAIAPQQRQISFRPLTNISKNSFIEGTHCLPQHDSECKGDHLVGRSRLVGIVTGLGSCLWLIIPQLRESMSIGHIGAEYRLVILVMVDVLKISFFAPDASRKRNPTIRVWPLNFDLCFGFQIQMREQFRWESIYLPCLQGSVDGLTHKIYCLLLSLLIVPCETETPRRPC